MPNFPGSLDSISNPGPTTLRNAAGFELDVVISRLNDIAELLEAKVGISESVAVDVPAANTVLQSLTAGKSKWATLPTAALAANAATQFLSANGTTSSPSYSSTALSSIAEMNVTITGTGAPMLVIYNATHYGSTVGATFLTELFMDAVDTGVGRTFVIQGTNAQFTHTLVQPITPAAGSHLFDIRQSISSGSIVAHSVWRTLTVVEFRR